MARYLFSISFLLMPSNDALQISLLYKEQIIVSIKECTSQKLCRLWWKWRNPNGLMGRDSSGCISTESQASSKKTLPTVLENGPRWSWKHPNVLNRIHGMWWEDPRNYCNLSNSRRVPTEILQIISLFLGNLNRLKFSLTLNVYPEVSLVIRLLSGSDLGEMYLRYLWVSHLRRCAWQKRDQHRRKFFEREYPRMQSSSE